MNNKGQMLGYLVGFGYVAALIYFYVLTFGAQPIGLTGFTGELPLHIISASQYEDAVLLYAHDSAELAAEQALVELIGTSSREKCKKYLGYDLWSKGCTLQTTYEDLFSENIGNLLKSYPQQKTQLGERFVVSPEIKDGYYKLSLDGSHIIGTRNKPSAINFYSGDNQTAVYEFIPSFSIATRYDYDILRAIDYDLGRLSASSAGSNPFISVEGKVGGCLSTKAEELFYDVVEKVGWCMQSEADKDIIACRCDLSQTNLNLLENDYSIVFDDGKASLMDKNGNAVVTHPFESDVFIAYQKPDEEFSLPSLRKAARITLRWDGNNFMKIEDVGYDNKLSVAGSLFHYKNKENNFVAMLADKQRTSLYEQFATCAPPTLKKFRVCIDGGEIDNKPVRFKFAVDSSRSS